MAQEKGRIFIVSGPAGSGKGTVVKLLAENYQGLSVAVSATTRKPRPGEVDGESYYFISKEEFDKRVEEGKFLEYACFSSNYYGTLKSEVDKIVALGSDVILEIEVVGAMRVMSIYPEAISIMLTPPDKDVLEKRLRGRNTEDEAEIQKRLARSKEEIMEITKYHYSVINHDNKTNECADQVYSIVEAIRLGTQDAKKQIEHLETKNTKAIIEKFRN
ncbi:MAG: guanylate kinase [Clostridia bacterium]|nr:guanylate kinase [Clostridia bacterium]